MGRGGLVGGAGQLAGWWGWPAGRPSLESVTLLHRFYVLKFLYFNKKQTFRHFEQIYVFGVLGGGGPGGGAWLAGLAGRPKTSKT